MQLEFMPACKRDENQYSNKTEPVRYGCKIKFFRKEITKGCRNRIFLMVLWPGGKIIETRKILRINVESLRYQKLQ
jgi:hypothetical protein